MKILFGIDELLKHPPNWKRERIGLFTNHAATTHDLIPSRKALLDHQFNLVKLFSPEHGMMVNGADGKAIPHSLDELTGLPIQSLYFQDVKPKPEDLSGIQILLFDVPDIGVRFYTYLWSLTHLMEVCAAVNCQLVVLDRPNPISGNMDLVEGPLLDPNLSSFIGRWPIPVRHSCTLGELARYFKHQEQIAIHLEIQVCKNWRRNEFQPDWGSQLVATSPAIQSFNSMLLYPGLCFLEATNLSEGRGTTLAFSQFGAPWFQAKLVLDLIHKMGFEELLMKEVSFTPTEGKYQGILCHGIHLKVVDAVHFKPVFFGLLLIKICKELFPNNFGWSPYPTLVNPTGAGHLDKLLGLANAEQLFELPLPKFIANITKFCKLADWETTMAPYLLYHD